MCPDPVLLVAYLDGTLFSRDATAVEQHLSNCERCATILAAMRQERAAAANPPGRLHRWMIPAAITVVAIAGLGVWAFWSRPKDASLTREATSARSVAPTPAATSVPTSPTRAEPSPSVARDTPKPTLDTPQPKLDIPKPKGVAIERTLRTLVQWRTRDLVVERSTDGGETWTTEYTADRPIRASAIVSAHVAWLVGDDGLVLRRTKNGWFGASPPAAGHITAVRATSPSQATVTLEDGRVFTTQNGGVTWSAP